MTAGMLIERQLLELSVSEGAALIVWGILNIDLDFRSRIAVSGTGSGAPYSAV